MEQAQRARGIGEANRFKRMFSIAFALLILALRRASSLATAMEARGFSDDERTWARLSSVHRQDRLFVLGCLAVITVALLTSVLTGHFNFLGISTIS